MKITFVLPPAGMNGGIRVVAIYAKYLQDRGHSVTLVSPPHRPLSLKNKVRRLLAGLSWKAQKRASHLDYYDLNHQVLDCYRAVTDADVPDADVVIATWWETAEWIARLSSSKGVKVYFIQGHEVFDYLPVERCKASYNLPLHKIVIAQWLADLMRMEYGDDIVDLVPNAVDHLQFFASTRGKQTTPTIGFLYSPSSNKGVDITLQVIANIRKSIPGLRVISFGSEQPGWPVEVANLIEFYYSPKQEDIRNLYAQCDLWITASKSEGFNLPAMEAMACRTPVASTKTGWPAEAIVTGGNGALVDIDDVDGLVRETEAILSLSDECWRKMSQNAYETVKDSSWKASSELFEKALVQASRRSGKAEISGQYVDIN